MEKKRYQYNGYEIVLERDGGVIYYTVNLEGFYFCNGFMPTDEPLDDFAKTVIDDLPDGSEK